MEAGIVISIIGVAVNVVVLLVGAVWAVGKISGQAAVLTNTIEHLDRTIIELKGAIDKLDGKVEEHERRLAVVEDRLERKTG